MDDDRGKSRRFFVDRLPPHAGETAPLPPLEAHHALHVLRLRVGAEVELFDGRGGRARGTISAAGRAEAAVRVRDLLPDRPRPQPDTCLGFAEPKGKRLDWLLEKATELGVAAIAPVRFARSVAGQEEMAEGRRQRWQAHCIAAAKQCGLDFLPEIRGPVSLPGFLQGDPASLRLLGDTDAAAVSARRALDDWRAGRRVSLLVGPEGGLAPQERREALAAGFIPVRLGSTTLRTETAAIALLAAVVAICDAGEIRDATLFPPRK